LQTSALAMQQCCNRASLFPRSQLYATPAPAPARSSPSAAPYE
jgi:hypothetical protein